MSDDRFTELVDWVDGRLHDEHADRVAQAVSCGADLAIVRWMLGFRMLARALPLESVPPIVRQNLRRELRRRLALRPHTPPRELAGALVFDSREHLAVAGLRTTDPDEGVHLACAAPGVELLLDVHPAAEADRLDLSGQVFLDRGTSAPVFEAIAEGRRWSTRSTDGDLLGRFDLQRLPAETFGLRVTNGEFALTVALDLRRVRDVR